MSLILVILGIIGGVIGAIFFNKKTRDFTAFDLTDGANSAIIDAFTRKQQCNSCRGNSKSNRRKS